MDAHVALLRGINVGGRNRLPMKDLAALFAQAGCRGVRTYIQSGNVVFTAPPALARRVPAAVARAIEERCGFRSPVVTRTAAELREVVRANPFLASGVDAGLLHVAFLADAPSRAQAALLDPARSPPDAFVLQGREIHLHFPNGAARSRLTNQYFDSRLGTVSTVRNWRTVMALLAMADA